MKYTIIKQNKNGDTRSAEHIPTYEDFCEANISHIHDVKSVMKSIGEEIIGRGKIHDYTKLSNQIDFYNDLCNTLKGNMKFTDGEWSKLHYSKERHHLFRRVPEDVNLIDIIEMIADCVCAGKSRSGEVRDLKLDNEILKKAFENTVKLIDQYTVLISDKYNEYIVSELPDPSEETMNKVYYLPLKDQVYAIKYTTIYDNKLNRYSWITI